MFGYENTMKIGRISPRAEWVNLTVTWLEPEPREPSAHSTCTPVFPTYFSENILDDETIVSITELLWFAQFFVLLFSREMTKHVECGEIEYFFIHRRKK